MPLLECKSLTLKYGSMTVLSDISFSLEQGDYLCVVGENGSGKTTLMKAILNLIPVSGGEIRFADDFRRTEIGYLPQQTALQRDFPTTVGEAVISGCQNRKGLLPFYTSDDRKRASDAMERLGILSIKNKSYSALSGGQQQRVLLARALCATKSLLLLDEPAAALDPVATAELYELIDSLNHDDGITVIMISHDIAAAVRHASRLLHLKTDDYFFGSTEEYVHTKMGKYFIGDKENGTNC